MKTVSVELGKRSYPIEVGLGFEGLSRAKLDYTEALLVTDTNVGPLYADRVLEILREKGIETFSYLIRAGEGSKNLLEIGSIYEMCMKANLNRKSVIFALGGGVVGDMAGFAAATYMRGIDYIQIPTSLLAQVDSSVGGKTGIDFGGRKNMVGAFYQPKGVYIQTDVLRTLPKREFSAGMAEVVKYGVIYDGAFFAWLEEQADAILAMQPEVLAEMIGRCCQIKAAVVRADETEQKLRMILNYGHTVGHAIESAAHFSLLHGECVSIGMVAAMRLAKAKGIFSEGEERLVALLKRFGLPVSISGLDTEQVVEAMLSDKKSAGHAIHFVLPETYGCVCITADVTEDERRLAAESVVM